MYGVALTIVSMVKAAISSRNGKGGDIYSKTADDF